ncbi:hypothetical protein DAEQUDRAFT_414683 [Daedalea quercina L-15889]|uniref:Uncharacterized protein n=1 Tax=Daedalea quercina L-15889 TaxID=1314783 RepID=A0A165THZ1_9APHY|nr:hypothetical protein DAEQUDRAFT_414683 [Daedalea quercina L-15889]
MTSSSSVSSSSSAAAAGHSSKSTTVIGAVLGSLLGTLILVLLILIWLLLRRHSRRARDATDPPPKSSSSSFWNRSTTVFSRRKSRRQTPIWTEWQMVNPEDFEDRGPQSPHSPGEGVPRDSGDEADPFLNRSGANEMSQTQTGTDTLVSLPAAAALAAGTASTRRSTTTTHVGGPIMPREELLARMNEEDAALAQVRLVSPSTDEHTSPLLPPPPLGSDRRSTRAGRSLNEAKSTRSMASAAFSGSSEKSGSIDVQEQERAELLTARRVKVGNYGQPAAPDTGTSSITSGTSGLERLANLSRMSWFRRMSFLPAPVGSRPGSRDVEGDNYTRTPPRSHSRQGSRSRPVSWAPLPTSEPNSSTPESSASRRPRPPSSFPQGLGLLVSGERPQSSVSAKSGSTVYHDARETPGSSMVDVDTTPAGTLGSNRSQPGAPPVPPLPQARSTPVSPLAEQTPGTNTRGGYLDVPSTEPPTYEESERDSPHSSGERPGDPVDVLDMPVPRPASPFTAASGSIRTQAPPGLPNPSVWRDSHATSEGTSSTSGIRIDVLEEAPPSAQDGWRTLSGNTGAGQGTRRTTFGQVPAVIHPRDNTQSERGSLGSGRSHLSPHVLQSSASTAPSFHTHHSSSSKSHSQGPSGSSGSRSASHAGSIAERSRLEQVSEVSSPPLSAVFSKDGVWSRPTSPPGVRPMTPIRQSPSSSAEGLPAFPEPRPATPNTAGGTVTSTTTSKTEDSGAGTSVTTSGTDPVSGVVLHFPPLPWHRPSEQTWSDTRRDDDILW